MLKRVVPVQRYIDGHALTAQPAPNGRGQDLEVLDDQHPHDPLVVLSPVRMVHLDQRMAVRPGPTMTNARCQHGVGRRHRADTAGGIQPLANAASANDKDDDLWKQRSKYAACARASARRWRWTK